MNEILIESLKMDHCQGATLGSLVFPTVAVIVLTWLYTAAWYNNDVVRQTCGFGSDRGNFTGIMIIVAAVIVPVVMWAVVRWDTYMTCVL